jgi:ABC-type transport system involved in cytochrome bd biosynthesis fused ATPase/permease subunit
MAIGTDRRHAQALSFLGFGDPNAKLGIMLNAAFRRPCAARGVGASAGPRTVALRDLRLHDRAATGRLNPPLRASNKLLAIENLRVAYPHRKAKPSPSMASRCISTSEISVSSARSGCGKSTIAKAIRGNLPEGARASSVRFDGREPRRCIAIELRRIRWRDIALIPQNAMNGFDPVYTIE